VTRGEAWLFHVANALVAATGVGYALAAYVAEAEDPYAIVHHPLQPSLQHAHVALAPALVFALGVIWARHAQPRVVSGAKARRSSGIFLLALALPMVGSGYAIQLVVEPSWRTCWVGVHLVTSGLWIAATLAHVLRRAPARARGEEPAAASPRSSSGLRSSELEVGWRPINPS
jgi:hypothetical protein